MRRRELRAKLDGLVQFRANILSFSFKERGDDKQQKVFQAYRKVEEQSSTQDGLQQDETRRSDALPKQKDATLSTFLTPLHSQNSVFLSIIGRFNRIHQVLATFRAHFALNICAAKYLLTLSPLK